jgi:hypothetical protein
MRRHRWQDDAACHGQDVAVFFPEPFEHRNVGTAKKICAVCPVFEECKAEHIDEQHGIWFGTTVRERQRLRIQMRRDAGMDPLNAHSLGNTYAVGGKGNTTPRVRPPIEHSTARGYRQHIRQKVEVCQPCRDAYNQAERFRKRGVYWATEKAS